MHKLIFGAFCMAATLIMFQCAVKKGKTEREYVMPAPNPNYNEAPPGQSPEEIAADNERKMLAAAESVEQGATSDWLLQGKEIMNNHCGSCHKAKDPIKYDEASWVRHMSRMVPKAKLSEEQAKFLRVYTIALIRTKK
jgi:cytochrome c5